MAADLKKQWQEEVSQLQLSTFEKVNQRRTQAYTDYSYPQPQADGSVIVMKSGIGDIDRFVKITDGHEEKIYTPGIVNDAGMLSAHDSVIVWNEFGFNPRWRVKNFSLVKLYDQVSGKKRIIGDKHNRYASAALSPDGAKIVSIKSRNDYKNTVVVFEYFTGKVIFEYSNGNDFYAMPRWSSDGNKIILLRTTPEGKTISSIDVQQNSIEDLVPVTRENIGHPVATGDYILFNSPVSGIDNIYALDTKTKARYQITSSRYGAYNPALSADGKTLYYNDQSRDGLDVVKMSFDPGHWIKVEPEVKPFGFSDVLAKQEGHPHLLDSVPATELKVKKYSRLSGLINPYSWGPSLNNDLTNINFGVGSKNLLSTTEINAGYVYDINERTGLLRANVSYQGLYPIIDFKIEKGNRETDKTSFGNKLKSSWDETTVEGGLRIPLLLTHSKYYQELTVGNAVGWTRSSDYESTISRNGTLLYRGSDRFAVVNDTLRYIYKDALNNGDLVYNHFMLAYSHVLKTSYRDYLYRWGQTLSFELYNTPYAGDFDGRLWAARSAFYFPGIGKHHYLYFRGAYQESLQGIETNLYSFRNRIPKPRGYSYPSDEKFVTLSANYSLPVWYPDIALGPILNIQRVKLNAFVDYGKGSGHEYYYHTDGQRVFYSLTDAKYLSAGVETTFDFNLMRFLPKFELGFRTTYRTSNVYNASGVVFEILVGNIGF